VKKSSYRPSPDEQESLPSGRRSAQKTLLLDDDLKPAFTQIPNWLYTMKGPSVQARHMFGYLLMYARESDHCWPGQDTISKDLSITRFTAMRWLQELEDWGLLLVHRRGLGHSNVYYLRSNKHLKKPEEESPPATLDVVSLQHQPDVTDLQHQKVEDLRLPKVAGRSHKQDVVEQDVKEQDAASAAAARATPVQEVIETEDVLRLRNALGAACQVLGILPTKAQETEIGRLRAAQDYSLDEFVYSMRLATDVYQDRAADQQIGSPWRYFRKILDNELAGDRTTPATVLRPLPESTEPLVGADGTPANDWEAIKGALKTELPGDNYPMWFAPSRLQGHDEDGTLVVSVPSDTHVYWLGDRLAKHVTQAAHETGVTVPWRFVVVPVQQSTAPPPRTLALSRRRKRDYSTMPAHEWASLPYDEMQEAIHDIDPCPECRWLRPKHSAACSLGGAR